MPRLDDDEIERLARNAGLTAADVSDVVEAYNLAVAVDGADDWTGDEVRNWVATQVSTRGGDTAVVLGQSRPGHSAKPAEATGEDGGDGGGGVFSRMGAELASRVNESTLATDEAMGRAQRTRDRFYRVADFVFDSGPAFDAGAMAQSLAVGVFTDASGNPVIDPETGLPTEVNATTLWQAIKGQTFDMGSLALPRAPGRRKNQGQERAGREGADDARMARLDQIATERRRFVTPSMAMALLSNMDDDALIAIQQQLWEAGLFGEVPPSWGVADEVTRKAYMGLFAEASLTPDEPIDRVLARLTDEAITRGANGSGASAEDLPAFKPEVASKESLSAMVDDIAQDLLGRFATDDEKARIVSSLQSKEIETQRQQYDRDLAEATGGGGTTAGGGGGGIDAFMAAIGGLESGGNYNAQNPSGASGKYQIMPANWGPWAEKAGLGRNAPRTPENQEIVARHVMSDYYRQFGNWRDVAIAWFAGPGAVGDPSAERRSDGNMTVRDYANSIMDRMGEAGAGTASGPGQYGAIETFDPQTEAEAALKAADPAGWTGHQFAGRAAEFYGLLSGVV